MKMGHLDPEDEADMEFPERFSNLPAYAFPRLRALLEPYPAGGDPIRMTIGEPQHGVPDFVGPVLAKHTEEFGQYPVNDGAPELLAAIVGWLKRRYDIDVDPHRQVLALNGTREGLFNACLALCPEKKSGQQPVILIPNPFYQVYAVAALSANAKPVFVPALEETGFMPDFTNLPKDVLDQTAIAYICSPSNPQGAIASRQYWQGLILLAEKHDFRIFADECYSEIYRDQAPVGALQVAREIGADPERVNIFHSLSKRSNLPGLRSGFTVGGPKSIAALKQLRNYAGAPLPMPLQRVAQTAWSDEDHVIASRELYQEKYQIADQIFSDLPDYKGPQGGFFLWLKVEHGEQAAIRLWTKTGVQVLPGAYLARPQNGTDPAAEYIRVAMVAKKDEMTRGLQAIRQVLM